MSEHSPREACSKKTLVFPTEPVCDCGVCNTCLHPWHNYPDGESASESRGYKPIVEEIRFRLSSNAYPSTGAAAIAREGSVVVRMEAINGILDAVLAECEGEGK